MSEMNRRHIFLDAYQERRAVRAGERPLAYEMGVDVDMNVERKDKTPDLQNQWHESGHWLFISDFDRPLQLELDFRSVHKFPGTYYNRSVVRLSHELFSIVPR